MFRVVRNVGAFAQSQPMNKWQSWGLNPALSDTKATGLSFPGPGRPQFLAAVKWVNNGSYLRSVRYISL